MADPRDAEPPLVSFDDGHPLVYGFLLRRCGRVDVAEELTAATFVSALSQQDRESWPPQWLLVIARNKLIDHWRRSSRAKDHEDLQKTAARTEVADISKTVNDRMEIAHVIGLLSPDHQAVIVLRHIDDQTVAKCAEELGRSVRATESLLGRAEAAFRAKWTEYAQGSS